jgi:hypothetical protein
MSEKTVISIVLASCLLMAFCDESAAEDALTVIRMVDAKEHSDTARREMAMTVYPDMNDAHNKREFVVAGYSRGDDDEFMEFAAPRTIKGLRILGKGDDNWVYFPSTGRTRKIAGKSKKESVQGVGGDFSYEDMGGGTLEKKYDFRLVNEDAKSWVLEGASRKPDSVYTKAVVTVDKASRLMKKIEYYTAEDGHYKDLLFEEIKTMGGREIATRMTMTNLRKESKTVVVILAAEYDIPVDDKYFNPSRFNK